MMRRRSPLAVVVLLLLAPGLASAEDPPITILEIHGTRRALNLETRAGEALDLARIERDVRRLWATAWFEDIQVAADETARGLRVTFTVVEKPRIYLRRVRFTPAVEQLKIEITARRVINAAVAARLAAQVRNELVEQGFIAAQVEPEIVPVDLRHADLLLKVNRGDLHEFDAVHITGSPGFEAGELRRALASIRPRRILPGLGPVWGGWRLRLPYSRARLQSEIEKLRSLYLAHGYFDARIELGGTMVTKGKVTVTLRVDSGAKYNIARIEMAGGGPPRAMSQDEAFGNDFCRCLLQMREESEKRGELEFNPRLELEPVEPGGANAGETQPAPGAAPSVTSSLSVDPGRAYRVGRIEFRGHRALSDTTLRRALVLHEGDLFDAGKLRKSLVRLNRISPLQGVGLADIRIEPNSDGGFVNLTIPVKERPRGYWVLSGPLGPLDAFGPLSYSIGSRLPAIGRGPFEFSTYYATLSVAAWPTALAGIAGLGTSTAWSATVALQRPYTPGQRWTSGILVSPQLGWRGAAAGYGLARLSEAARAVARVDSSVAPSLSIPVMWRPRHRIEPIAIGILQCDAPQPRLAWLRSYGLIVLDSASGLLLASQGR